MLVKILKLRFRQDLKLEFGQFFLSDPSQRFGRNFEVEVQARFEAGARSVFFC